MVLWNFYRYLLSRSIIDYITSVSKITARENGIRNAIIVPNATLCKPLDPCKDYSRGHNHNFRIVTYVSIGGGKIESIPTAVTVVNHLNRLLKQNNLQILLFSKFTVRKYQIISHRRFRVYLLSNIWDMFQILKIG
jgi:hypothetical protein